MTRETGGNKLETAKRLGIGRHTPSRHKDSVSNPQRGKVYALQNADFAIRAIQIKNLHYRYS